MVKLRNRSMKKNAQNVVGAQVRRIRTEKEMTQEQLAARCGILGWDLSRGTLAKIEAQVRCVTDAELYAFAKALKCGVVDLYPADSVVLKVLG